MNDALRKWSGEPVTIGFGDKPAVVVVDFQDGFTRDPDFLMDGAPLIDRAIANTARLLDVARAFGVPVATCYTAYKSERDMPYWKLTKMRELLIHGHPATELDSRIYDPDYDLVVCKTGASIFFQTPVVNYLIKERVDTVIVTGCTTSGCVRASVVDSMSYNYRTIVASDGVGDRALGPHEANLFDMGQKYADLLTCDEIVAHLLKQGTGGAKKVA